MKAWLFFLFIVATGESDRWVERRMGMKSLEDCNNVLIAMGKAIPKISEPPEVIVWCEKDRADKSVPRKKFGDDEQ